MSEDQYKRGLNLIRYVGILVTVLFFIAALAFAAILPSTGSTSSFTSLLPYVVMVTVVIAGLSVILYFGYSRLQGGRVKKS